MSNSETRRKRPRLREEGRRRAPSSGRRLGALFPALSLAALLLAAPALGASPVPAPRASARILIPGELELRELAPGVLMATHRFPWESNSLVVGSRGEDLVLVDTPYTEEATKLLLELVRRELAPRSIRCLLTGYHIDNAGGVGALRAAGLPVLASTRTARLVEEEGPATLRVLLGWLGAPGQARYREHYGRARILGPDSTFPEERPPRLSTGSLTLEIFHPGPSHAKDNLAVNIPERGILFGSCIVKAAAARDLGFTGDADLASWPEALRRLEARFPAAALVVPHHGEPGGRGLIEHSLRLLGAR